MLILSIYSPLNVARPDLAEQFYTAQNALSAKTPQNPGQILQADFDIFGFDGKAQPEMARRFKEFPRHDGRFQLSQLIVQRLGIIAMLQPWKHDHRARRHNAFQQILS